MAEETDKWCVLPYLDRVVAHLESLVNALHHLVEACEIKAGWWLSVQLTDASSQSHQLPKLCLLLIYVYKKDAFQFFCLSGRAACFAVTHIQFSFSKQATVALR